MHNLLEELEQFPEIDTSDFDAMPTLVPGSAQSIKVAIYKLTGKAPMQSLSGLYHVDPIEDEDINRIVWELIIKLERVEGLR